MPHHYPTAAAAVRAYAAARRVSAYTGSPAIARAASREAQVAAASYYQHVGQRRLAARLRRYL